MNSLERKFVHNTYQKISNEFSNTRAYLWKSVKDFLDSMNPNSIIIEVGSGNGKNLVQRDDCYKIAIDLCSNFCKISREQGIDSIIANNLSIPLTNNVADYVLSIAVIHHLSSENRRQDCINELVRILKPGGKLLIQVWALEQDKLSKRQFTKQDNYVEFCSPDKKMKELRFYHVFKQGELDNMFKNFKNIHIEKSFWEKGNWVILLKKIKV